MKLYYDIKDKPKFPQLIVFAIQQLLAIMAATLVVPIIIGNGMQPSAALFGAGVGTLVYVAFTKASSPVFLGSSFAFLGSMSAAFAGAVSASAGYAGLIIGAIFAGLVYVVIALAIKFAGVNWINKLMPKQVIGPTVAIIGLSLAGNAVGDLQCFVNGAPSSINVHAAVACGLVTLFVTMICSTYGKKSIKLIPFIIGILAGYAFAAVLTLIGTKLGNDSLKLIDFSVFSGISVFALPEFTFLTAAKGIKEIDGAYIGTIAAAYLPVAFVVFAEHIADHKNISSIIGKDLLEEPGLHRTLLGDGVGSIVGAFFGGCPNTTYGESVACVALTRNASVYTIIAAAIGAIIISFFEPFVAFVDSIPACVMGGVCMALYGFIAVSGLKMVKEVNLEDNRNLYTVSVILIAGIGGLTLGFGKITITSIACALILGIITNLVLSKAKTAE
ncbi:MAG: uracil-xanthine permease [Ruminococcaceae bacterium]|nr:uracil-xanthine permease [Oscillospiraceae bacterium]